MADGYLEYTYVCMHTPWGLPIARCPSVYAFIKYFDTSTTYVCAGVLNFKCPHNKFHCIIQSVVLVACI